MSFTNQGDNDEFNIKVSLKIARASGGQPLTLTKTVPRVAKGEKITVTLPLNRPPPLDTALTITTTVAARAGREEDGQQQVVVPVAVRPGVSLSAVSEFSDAPGVVALAAAAAALVALVWLLVLSLRLRRVRSAQQVVLGEHGQPDLVAHAAELQRAFEALARAASRRSPSTWPRGWPPPRTAWTARSPTARSCAMTPTTRCPATSPRRSPCSTPTTMASCSPRSPTATRPACTASRSTAGRGEQQLSPEEEEAVRLALAGEVGSVILSEWHSGQRFRRSPPCRPGHRYHVCASGSARRGCVLDGH